MSSVAEKDHVTDGDTNYDINTTSFRDDANQCAADKIDRLLTSANAMQDSK